MSLTDVAFALAHLSEERLGSRVRAEAAAEDEQMRKSRQALGG
jgi:hypothetical protein